MAMATPDDPHDRFLSRRLSERMEFGELLIEKREKRGLKRSQIAQEIGVDPAQILRWEEQGSVPKDNFILDLAAWHYRLNEKEKERWRALSGLSSDPRVEYGNTITFIESTTVEIQRLVYSGKTHQYMEPLRNRANFGEVQTLWHRIRPHVLNLYHRKKEAKKFLPQYLVVELAASIAHCLGEQGELYDRLEFLTMAAEAAKAQGQVTWRGYFLGDGIAWPKLMIYRDPAHMHIIRDHLHRARALAIDDEDNGTNDLYVTTSSFLAMTHLFENTGKQEEMERKLREADRFLTQAYQKPCSSIAESRREWAAGERAKYLGKRMEAKSHFERAVNLSFQFTDNTYLELVSAAVPIGELYLEEEDLDRARMHFMNILTTTPTDCLGPYERAQVDFSLAKVEEKAGDNDAARAYAINAKSALLLMQPRPYLDQEVTALLSRLPRPRRKRSSIRI